jgi:hypothetical protein
MAKAEGRKCNCRVAFTRQDGSDDTCHCDVHTEHPSGVCHFCRGDAPFRTSGPAHTPSDHAAKIRKLPQYTGKSSD